MTFRATFHEPENFLAEEVARDSKTEALRDIRVIRACAIGLITIAAITGGAAAGDLLAPTAIAIVLALVLAPITHALEDLRIPSAIAAILTVAVTVLVLAAGTMAFGSGIRDWVNRAPDIVHSVEHKLRPIKQQLAAVETASQQITRVTPAPVIVPAPSLPVTDGLMTSVLYSAPHLFAKILYVGILTLFLLAYRKHYTDQLILLPRNFLNRVRMARICRDVRLKVSGYLFILAMINAGLAALTALCFTLAGINDAVVWGLVFGTLNFIPIVGPTVVILAAAVVSFATSDTIMGALLPPLILLGLNTIEANLVQPWLLSRRIVASPVGIFVMVATLVWMWGVAAAITAVPMLILFHTIAQHVPALRPLARLLATEDRSSRGRNGAASTGTIAAFIRLPTGKPFAR